MQFNPGVNDISGQILGQGVAGAADTRAKMMSQMGQDIGGALESIGGALTQSLEFNNMGDSAYEALGAIGEMYPGMKGVYTSLGKMDPRTRRLAAVSITQNLGAVSQLGIAGMSNQTRQQGQAIQSMIPYTRNEITSANTRAAEGDAFDGTVLP